MNKYLQTLCLITLLSTSTAEANRWQNCCLFLTLYVYPAYVIYTNYTTPQEDRRNLFHAIRYLSGACTMSAGVMFCCVGCFSVLDEWCKKKQEEANRILAEYEDWKSRHVMDVSQSDSQVPLFLSQSTIKQLQELQRTDAPHSQQIFTISPRPIVEALHHWRRQGVSIQQLISLLRRPDKISGRTHTMFVEEFKQTAEILGLLSDDEINQIVQTIPNTLVDVADALERISCRVPTPQEMV